MSDGTRVRTGHRTSNIDLVFTNEQFMVDEVQIILFTFGEE